MRYLSYVGEEDLSVGEKEDIVVPRFQTKVKDSL